MCKFILRKVNAVSFVLSSELSHAFSVNYHPCNTIPLRCLCGQSWINLHLNGITQLIYFCWCSKLFETTLEYVGSDYLCFPLWDKFIEYEISEQDWCSVATLCTRVLEIPNQQLDRYFEGNVLGRQFLSKEDSTVNVTCDLRTTQSRQMKKAMPKIKMSLAIFVDSIFWRGCP
ncbi:uncharacterized protein [Henckelia pumila]|uniref:uncharacterized protein isoform X2 n=1 Tax=Henckelia pumila TaxID=405737 RepID=UPI003C6E6CFE